MLIYFLRHAEAEDTSPQGDAGRRLTDKGVQRSREVGRALAAMDVAVDLVLCSPLQRALETADAVLESLEARLEVEDDLGGNLDLEALRDMLEAHGPAGNVLLVGHEPDLSRTISLLIGGGRIEMKKGAVACVETLAPVAGAGVLRWLLTGRQMELMG
ncbi:MAG: phosphohistidine phosphatase SixA [Armatimonadia bacterium]